jgi:hypothetical protein
VNCTRADFSSSFYGELILRARTGSRTHYRIRCVVWVNLNAARVATVDAGLKIIRQLLEGVRVRAGRVGSLLQLNGGIG